MEIEKGKKRDNEKDKGEMSTKEQLERIGDNLAVVLGKKAGHLGETLRDLDEAAKDTAGELGHYLSKRSYQKAWDYLNPPPVGDPGRQEGEAGS